MHISIRDFRCFHRVDRIEVRPINILVGENSAGKSSLLSAIRFLFELFQSDGKASFNKDPFFLGAYEQIAHYRGGRFGRAKEFSFLIQGRIRKETVARRLKGMIPTSVVLPEHFDLTVEFQNNRSQPAISRVIFDAENFGFEAKFGESIVVDLKTPNLRFEFPSESLGDFRADPYSYELSFLNFALSEARFITSREGGREDTSELEIRVLVEIFRVASRDIPSSVYASAPVRSKPERTYNPGEANPSPGGEHIPFVLAQIRSFEKDRWEEIVSSLEKFGNASGLFEEIGIRQLGNTEGGPFQLTVTLNGSKSNIIDVGYGVSQVLPIITDLVRARQSTTFLFQQPEVHLHPKAQAELASFFCQIVRGRRHTLFVETHSDNLIDRIRMEARDGTNVSADDVSILFFERSGLDVEIHQITLDQKGNLRGAPASYRQFFIEEEFRSLGG